MTRSHDLHRPRNATSINRKLGLFLGCVLALCFHPARGLGQGVPGTVPLIARLADNGVPVTGVHAFSFKLFPSNAGGTEVWAESQPSVPVVDGLSFLELGSSVPLDGNVFSGRVRFLEVSIDGTTLSPRLAVVSVPYALRAGVAASAESLAGLLPEDLVTSVTAGPGLLGGGSGGDVALSANFTAAGGDSGSATTVARGDHGHDATTREEAYARYLALVSCAPGQVPKSGPSGWICANDANTTYTFTNGLAASAGVVTPVYAGTGAANTMARSDHVHPGGAAMKSVRKPTLPFPSIIGTGGDELIGLSVTFPATGHAMVVSEMVLTNPVAGDATSHLSCSLKSAGGVFLDTWTFDPGEKDGYEALHQSHVSALKVTSGPVALGVVTPGPHTFTFFCQTDAGVVVPSNIQMIVQYFPGSLGS